MFQYRTTQVVPINSSTTYFDDNNNSGSNFSTSHSSKYDFLSKLVRYLQSNALSTPNLFGGGAKNEVQYVQSLLSKDENCQLTEATKDPRVVAEVLMQYFAGAKDPLIPFDLYDSFLLAQTILEHKMKIKYIRWLFSNLPRKSQEFLQKLFKLLNELSLQSATNFSDSESLANLFGNILLRPSETLYYMVKDQKDIWALTTIFIQDAEKVIKLEPVTMMRVSASAPNLVNMENPNNIARMSLDKGAVRDL